MRAVEQRAELHVLVAGEAGVRRAARGVCGHERVDDVVAELLLHVEHVVRDADALGGGTRVRDILDAAAGAARAERVGVLLGVEAEGDADDVVALLVEEGGGDGGIDAAGHGYEDALWVRHAPIVGEAGGGLTSGSVRDGAVR